LAGYTTIVYGKKFFKKYQETSNSGNAARTEKTEKKTGFGKTLKIGERMKSFGFLQLRPASRSVHLVLRH